MRKAPGAVALLVVAACTVAPARRPVRPSPSEGSLVRVALLLDVPRVTLSATGGWRIADSDGRSTLVRGVAREAWTIERAGPALRAVRADGAVAPERPTPFVAAPEEGAFVTVNGRRYRGEIVVLPRDGGLLVVNRLPVESYLRGVVPLEIGRRAPEERAAVEAQAVAARSYTYVRLRDTAQRAYDLRASPLDQVYGGVEAEHPTSDEALAATRGLVLTFGGRVVSTPYYSSCGGRTAAPSEVWRSPDEPYLASVSDTIPGTTRVYCESSPSVAWTRTFERSELARALSRYLAAYARVPSAGPGTVRAVSTDGRTTSGRVRAVIVRTDAGEYALRGNDMRFVLRAPGGEILPSTYFSLETVSGADGRPLRLVLHGRGNGHGVGMCQWGAIGRARAGQHFRAILQTYYPGTSVDALQR